MTICSVCRDFHLARSFPDAPEDSGCAAHSTTACLNCWQRWISDELKRVQPGELRCFECQAILKESDVKLRATVGTYERYMQLVAFINRPPLQGTYRECLRATCDSGQIQPDDDSTFQCQSCTHKHCVPCQMAFHEGVNCEAPLLERKRAGVRFEVIWKGKMHSMLQAHKSEEDATGEVLDKTCKNCPEPSCGVKIMKAGGCEMMECYKCGLSFCWLCLAPQSNIEDHGSAGHKDDCPLWRRPGIVGPQHVDIDNAEDLLALGLQLDEEEDEEIYGGPDDFLANLQAFHLFRGHRLTQDGDEAEPAARRPPTPEFAALWGSGN